MWTARWACAAPSSKRPRRTLEIEGTRTTPSPSIVRLQFQGTQELVLAARAVPIVEEMGHGEEVCSLRQRGI